MSGDLCKPSLVLQTRARPCPGSQGSQSREEDLERRVPSLPWGLGQQRLSLDREDGGLPGGGAACCFEWEVRSFWWSHGFCLSMEFR